MLVDGGTAGMFWSYCWVIFGQFFIVLSLAEMSSMAPTAGGSVKTPWLELFLRLIERLANTIGSANLPLGITRRPLAIPLAGSVLSAGSHSLLRTRCSQPNFL